MRERFSIIAVVLALAALATMFLLVRPATAPGILLRMCPDAWYDNQMPPVQPDEQRQYFIVNGERRELSEFDVDWIKAHCSVNKPRVVY